MLNASLSFQNLAIYVGLPRDGGDKFFKAQAIRFLNVFFSGNYWNLPEYESVSASLKQYKKSRKYGILHKIITTSILGLFLAFPVVLWLIAKNQYGLEVEPTSNTLLSILYTIWCTIGILSFLDDLAPEAKELIQNIFLSYLSKK